jgi:hypothetical protein
MQISLRLFTFPLSSTKKKWWSWMTRFIILCTWQRAYIFLHEVIRDCRGRVPSTIWVVSKNLLWLFCHVLSIKNEEMLESLMIKWMKWYFEHEWTASSLHNLSFVRRNITFPDGRISWNVAFCISEFLRSSCGTAEKNRGNFRKLIQSLFKCNL